MGSRSPEDDPEDPFTDPLDELPEEDYKNLVPQARGGPGLIPTNPLHDLSNLHR